MVILKLQIFERKYASLFSFFPEFLSILKPAFFFFEVKNVVLYGIGYF
jgi:hypothetical protein